MKFEVHFVDGTVEEFIDILDAKPNKEDEPKLMWLMRKNTSSQILLNLGQVKYIVTKD